jgi:hypothetical protein
MKRYTLNKKVTRTVDHMSMRENLRVDSSMEESPNGDWVHWSDVEKLREYLEGQIPEKRIEKLERMIGLVHEGKCPECLQKTRGYKAPLGSFAPEAFATLREMGIDPCTGHRFGCSLANAESTRAGNKP